MYYGLFKHVLLGPPVKAYYRPWVEGADNVPAEGGAILASNHLSFSDSIFLPLVLKRKVVFLGKEEYFTGSGVKGYATKAFMEGVGTIPVHRGGGRASEAALRTGMQVVQGGELLGIYPEGTRSPDGRLYRGKTGVARLAIEAGVPIVPVAMIGTDIAQPIGQRVPSRTDIGVRIGPPIDPSEYSARQDDREALRELTDTVMAAIAGLSGQEIADRDAAQYKRELDKAARIAAEDLGPSSAS
ncbi:lysophospholipid acyltransferase family protein [Demequina capsici]|uniref:Lysophospholipid acyltransferase family protein n=1 Tax=Demequina capsici TaxID=3075620 RepID=A0AA96F987_9MICO|nr:MULTISPECIES: lysophospholipid acyltransferase family protein [unclassified Demequina]WNM25687.1 lysophospholipid acyltransferase family protein [Demequina sp. OYTSA14]WNM28582.1 lysophospholipid acyltransferase family protein [Demequina sp. PMTSA13]